MLLEISNGLLDGFFFITQSQWSGKVPHEYSCMLYYFTFISIFEEFMPDSFGNETPQTPTNPPLLEHFYVQWNPNN